MSFPTIIKPKHIEIEDYVTCHRFSSINEYIGNIEFDHCVDRQFDDGEIEWRQWPLHDLHLDLLCFASMVYEDAVPSFRKFKSDKHQQLLRDLEQWGYLEIRYWWNDESVVYEFPYEANSFWQRTNKGELKIAITKWGYKMLELFGYQDLIRFPFGYVKINGTFIDREHWHCAKFKYKPEII